ncbi:hypothetical protein ACFY1U_22915 [Streptomyces sp. NPDC001351]|uniref:hypothetical protein n=1 Tax=Streptomyces sp. NPDC001351 TaxID=3364564 RepID=UPI00368E79E8
MHRGVQRLLELIDRAKATGHRRDDFTSRDLVVQQKIVADDSNAVQIAVSDHVSG